MLDLTSELTINAYICSLQVIFHNLVFSFLVLHQTDHIGSHFSGLFCVFTEHTQSMNDAEMMKFIRC